MANTVAIDFTNDILQPLQDADILRYRDICAKRLPMALTAHHILTLRHRWGKVLSQPENATLAKNISPKCVTKFYAPRNRNIDKCTFLAIAGESPTDPENSRYSIFLFTLQYPPTELISCLRDSARINWQLGPIFEAFSDDLMPIIEILLAQKGVNDYVNWAVTAQTVVLSKEHALAMDVNVPDDVFFGELKEDHASTINEEWIHRDSTSYNYIRSLILLNGGLGIFEKSTKRLLSWITINDYFAFGCLTTIPSARGRGLAKLLVKEYAKRFAKTEQLDIIAHIQPHRASSLSLFHGIGFKTVTKNSWVQLKNKLVRRGSEKKLPKKHSF